MMKYPADAEADADADADADDGRPLEWWESVQLDLLESIGMREEAERFRKSPAEWRVLRRQLKLIRKP